MINDDQQIKSLESFSHTFRCFVLSLSFFETMFSRVFTTALSPRLLNNTSFASSFIQQHRECLDLGALRWHGDAFDAAVSGHKGVLVFSKTTCPFCDRVKAAFAAKSIPYSVVELDRVDKAARLERN
jgi:thioredoxin-related protein